MTIKAQFTIFSIFQILVIAAAAAINFFTLTHLIGQAEQAQTASILLRRHLDGDMMHDAIRADVLQATLGLKSGNSKMIEEAGKEAAIHGERFLGNLRGNLSLDIPSDIHDLLRAEEPALRSYSEQAAALIAAAASDAKSGANRAAELLPAFEASFGTLETAQSGLSDRIEAFSSALRDRQIGAASSAESYALTLAVVTVLITSCLPVFAARFLFRPQVRLMDAMRDLAEGAVDFDVPFTGRRDEIGAMASALAVFQRNAVEKKDLERASEAAKKAEELARRDAMLGLADGFEQRIGKLVKTVAAAAADLRTTAETMSRVSRDTTERASSVVCPAERAKRVAKSSVSCLNAARRRAATASGA